LRYKTRHPTKEQQICLKQIGKNFYNEEFDPGSG